ncbi:MAG TPA: sodium:proton antiporter [Ktedonobacteraceae bacterium]
MSTVLSIISLAQAGNGQDALRSTEILVILLTITLVVSLLARRLRLPYTLVLVLVGLGIGFSPLANGVILNPDLVLFLFLPALLFEGAWSTDARQLVANWLPIFLLAVPGLLIALALLMVVLHLGIGLPWMLAALAAAIVSPTDPIAALALLKRLGLSERLRIIIEGESLFNDGVGVAVFEVVRQLLLPSLGLATVSIAFQGVSLLQLNLQVLWLLIGGPLLGIATGWICSRFLRLVDDHLFETVLTLCVAYAAYLCGTLLHTSGLLAVVCAGLVMGSYGKDLGMSQRSQEAAEDVWEFIGYLANSLLFLLLGIQIGASNFLQAVPGILWAVLGVLAGRAVIVYTLMPLQDLLARRLANRARWWAWLPRPRPLSAAWRPVLTLTGLRGALSIALVLSLPDKFSQRNLLESIVYGVVLVTLLGQGLGLRFLLPHWSGDQTNESEIQESEAH